MNPLLKRKILERQGYSPEEIERIVGSMDTGGAPPPGPAVPMAQKEEEWTIPSSIPSPRALQSSRPAMGSGAVRGINIGREQGMMPRPEFVGPQLPKYVSDAPRPLPQALIPQQPSQAIMRPQAPMMGGPAPLMSMASAAPSISPPPPQNGLRGEADPGRFRRGQNFFGTRGFGSSLEGVAEARSPELRSLVPPELPEEDEPFERAAQTEEMENRRRKLEGLRNIAEGFGNMNVITAGEIRRGIGPQPFVAEGIRREQAREEERITPDESQFLATQGYKVAAGMPRSIVAKAIPQYANLGYRREALEQRKLEEEGRSARGEGNLRERVRSGDLREKFGMRLPNKFRESLIGYEKALTELDVIGRKAETAKFGPISGRWQEFARKIGLADSGTAASAADVVNAVNQTIYQSTGKQLNEEEMRRITKTMPAVWDSPETFQAILQSVKERVRRNKSAELHGLRGDYDVSAFDDEEGGLDTEAMKEQPVPMNQATPAAEGKIRVRNKLTGQTGALPAANFDPEKYERL